MWALREINFWLRLCRAVLSVANIKKIILCALSVLCGKALQHLWLAFFQQGINPCLRGSLSLN